MIMIRILLRFVKLPWTDKYYIDAIPDAIKRDERLWF